MAEKRSAPKRGAVQHSRSPTEEQAARENEFKELEKLAAKYERKMRQAWDQIGGPKENEVRRDFEQVARLKDPAERKRKIDELKQRYDPLVQRACDAAAINPAGVRQEILGAVAVPSSARVEHEAGPAISWRTQPDFARPSPRPLQSFREIILAAPYQVYATLGDGAQADPSQGGSGTTIPSGLRVRPNTWPRSDHASNPMQTSSTFASKARSCSQLS